MKKVHIRSYDAIQSTPVGPAYEASRTIEAFTLTMDYAHPRPEPWQQGIRGELFKRQLKQSLFVSADRRSLPA